MNRIVVLLAAVVALSAAACKTSPVRWDAFAPASQADLDTLSADVARDRDNLRAGLTAVAKDLESANVEARETKAIATQVQRTAEEVAKRPASGGVPGALVNAIAGSGVLPGWLDWLLTLLGTALGINVARNRTRKAALEEVVEEVAHPPTPRVGGPS